MKKLSLVSSTLLTLVAIAAQAHAHLKASNPKEGETVMEVPTSISLTFSESARVTAVSIQKDQEAKQTLTAPTTAGEQISIAVPKLSAGSYTLTWRVASTDDNHIMSGELHFKVMPMKMDKPTKE
jgi:copper resistance protein C